MSSHGRVEKIAGGFQFTEGPVWIASRQELLFSDIHASKIMRYRNGQVDVFRDPSHQANGNTLDPHGRLITCEHETRRVTRTESDGRVIPIATHFQGKRLNSPNDVVCRSDGLIYFSDPPYAVKPEQRELDFQGVYRISEAHIELMVDDFDKPNGLAFSPDQSVLYIADTERGHIRAFDVAADGTLGNSREFCQVQRPDGLRVDPDGTLYIAGMTGVVVVDANGKQIEEITLPERPANVAFGDQVLRSLYICARTGLYRIRLA